MSEGDVPGRGSSRAAMLPLAIRDVLLFGYLDQRRLPPQTEWRAALAIKRDRNSGVGLILAYAARRLPLRGAFRVGGLQQTRAIWSSPPQISALRRHLLRRVTVPLIFANLLAGALLAFAFAMLR